MTFVIDFLENRNRVSYFKISLRLFKKNINNFKSQHFENLIINNFVSISTFHSSCIINFKEHPDLVLCRSPNNV